jgi:hypothetical protein
MRRLLLIMVSVSLLSICAAAQFPDSVIVVKSRPNNVIAVKGGLEQGSVMQDLSWAWNSSVACFPGTQKDKFTGNHVLYATTIPPYSELTVTVVPDNASANMSLYAYQIGISNYTAIVPNLNSCIACEAEHKWDRPKVGKKQDHTRSVMLNSTTDSYNIIIGVAGANNLKTGGYTLKLALETRETSNAPQEPVKVYAVKCAKNKIATVAGDLQNGVVIQDLSWAWNSSVACFPGTQKDKFTGKHVLYTTVQPAYSEMEVTVIPDDPNADFSIYAYQVGVNNKVLPPKLSSCVSCEAEHKWDRPKVGKTQDHTRTVANLTALNDPFRVFIGVAGANGLKKGGYKLKIKIIGNR